MTSGNKWRKQVEKNTPAEKQLRQHNTKDGQFDTDVQQSLAALRRNNDKILYFI